MFLKPVLAIILCAGALGLSGCETMNPAVRAANFEAQTRERFVGKSSDELVLTLGPPKSRATLSDGREVFQYETMQTATSYYYPQSSISIGTTIGGGRYGHRGGWGGTYGGVSVSLPFPNAGAYDQYQNNDQIICTRRFIINTAKKVEAFNYEGRRCY